MHWTNPQEVYAHFKDIKDSVLLESMNGEKIEKYSFIALFPFITIKAKGNRIVINDGKESVLYGNPFLILRDVLKKAKKHQDFKGAFGYFGYDLAWFIEDLPKKNKDEIGLPDLYFIFPKTLIVFEHKKKKIEILSPCEGEIRNLLKKKFYFQKQ